MNYAKTNDTIRMGGILYSYLFIRRNLEHGVSFILSNINNREIVNASGRVVVSCESQFRLGNFVS